MSLHLVTRLDQLEEAKPTLFTIAGRSIGLIRTNGSIYAVRNVCPHKRAPVCRGTLRGTMLPSDPGTFVFGLDNLVLQCPWHGWEFDLTTGRTVCAEGKGRLAMYSVTVKDGDVYVEF